MLVSKFPDGIEVVSEKKKLKGKSKTYTMFYQVNPKLEVSCSITEDIYKNYIKYKITAKDIFLSSNFIQCIVETSGVCTDAYSIHRSRFIEEELELLFPFTNSKE